MNYLKLCSVMLVASVVGVLGSGTVASASLIHSNVMGTSAFFTAITESSPTLDPLPLYDQPFAVGDELVFSPTGNFSANSVSGGPSDSTDGKLSLMITAKPGQFLDELKFSEVGLSILQAPFGGDAYTSVDALAVIQVVMINGQVVNLPASLHSFVFTPQNTFQHSIDATGPSLASAWVGALNVDLPALATKVLVTVDNILFAATTGTGTGALIDKKGFTISVVPDDEGNIPEPGTLALAILAIGSAACGRRKLL